MKTVLKYCALLVSWFISTCNRVSFHLEIFLVTVYCKCKLDARSGTRELRADGRGRARSGFVDTRFIGFSDTVVEKCDLAVPTGRAKTCCISPSHLIGPDPVRKANYDLKEWRMIW